MSRWFFVSDLHGKVDRYEKLFRCIGAERPPVVLLGGDLLPHPFDETWALDFGHPDFVADVLAAGFRRLAADLAEPSKQVSLVANLDDVALDTCLPPLALAVPISGTANVKTDAEILPARGVYVCHLHVQGETQGMWAVCNVGHNPTFGHQELGLEVHALSEPGDLLSRRVAVGFLQRLRAEVRFPTPRDLTEQIQKDVNEAIRVKEELNQEVELDSVDGIVLDSGVVSDR